MLRIVAASVLLCTLRLQAQEVAYSKLELQLTPPPAPPHAVQLAGHSEPLLSPAQQEFLPTPVASESSPNLLPTDTIAAVPVTRPLTEKELPMVVVPEGCADCIAPEYWEFNPWYGGAEIMLMAINYTDSLATTDSDRTFVTARPYLGYEDPFGTGIRGRFWAMSHDVNMLSTNPAFGAAGNPNVYEFEAGSFDLDLYKRFRFERSSLAVGGGLKIAHFGLEAPTLNPFITVSQDVDASGVSIFAELRHVVGASPNSEWAWVFRTRAGALAGTTEGRINNQLAYRADSPMFTFEAAFGTEYLRHYKHHDFVLNFMAESNYWNSEALDSVAFNGASFKVGFQW